MNDDGVTRRPASQAAGPGLTGAALVPGVQVLGRYVLEAEVGRGGMGVVWRASDVVLGETVALKFLPPAVARDAVAIDDLKTETRRARRLTHPHIVRIHDFTQQDDLAAVSMEFVAGSNLAQCRRQQPGKVYALAALTPLVRALCDALEYAHATARIVHRDLKPANLLLSDGGELKVTDFGIASSLTDTKTRMTLRQKDGVSGTIPYMSPQQLMGEKPLVTDDIYALGATLYELLTGRPPFFRGDIESMMLQVREKSPPSFEEQRTEAGTVGEPVPARWRDVILACLAKDASARPQSAREVSHRLGLSAEEPSSGAIASVRPTPAAKSGARRRKLLLAGAALGILGVAVAWRQLHPAKPTATPIVEKPPAVAAVPVVPRGFTVNVAPAGADARVWLGPAADVPVKDGQARLSDLADGEYELAVQATGFEPLTQRVRVDANNRAVNVTLAPINALLEVTARPGTTVQLVDAPGKVIDLGRVDEKGRLAVRQPLGAYKLRLRHPDFEPVDEAIELVVGRTAQNTIVQSPLPAELTLSTVPAGAELRLDGNAVGSSPRALKVRAEQPLRVEASHAGYRSAEETLTLAANEKRAYAMPPLVREVGRVVLQPATPEDLRVALVARVDGQLVTLARDATDWSIPDVASGRHTVQLSHGDYEPWQQTIEVRDRADAVVKVSLLPKPAELTVEVTGPTDYTLWANGESVKVVDRRVRLPALVDTVIEARAQGFRPIIGHTSFPAGAHKLLPLAFERQPLPRPGQPHENSLHMKFVPLPGTNVAFSIWETRVADYSRFLLATKRPRRTGDATVADGPNFPITLVTWQEARDFCDWLTAEERSSGNLGPTQSYRLPRDLEWSLAVGLGKEPGRSAMERNAAIKGIFPWGKEWPPPAAAGNFAGEETGNSRLSGYHDEHVSLAPVGQFRPTALGIFDLAGNVREWCDDQMAIGDSRRVVRGSSFSDATPNALLSSVRAGMAPTNSAASVGFRCVLDLGANGERPR
jgi:hypothetical protein